MKPLIVIELPEHTSKETHDTLIKHFEDTQVNGMLDDYEVLVIQGAKVRVYYPERNWLKFYYYKIKAWVILRTTKNK